MNSVEFGYCQFFMRVVLLSVVTFLFGCGGKENTNDQEDNHIIWYLSNSNSYISIDADDDVRFYRCTLYDGFAEETSVYGFRKANNLFIYSDGAVEPSEYQIIESESSYLSFDDLQIPFEVVSEIPTFCNGNAIEIIDVSPTEAIEGMETVFTLSFDYRLTNEEAIVEMGFTSGLDGSYTISQQDSVEIFSSGIGSGAMTVNHVPVLLESLMPYSVHVNLSPMAQDGPYSPFATDSVRITIIEN